MRFLLVTPCRSAGAAPAGESRVDRAASAVLESRSTSHPELLVQSWVDLDVTSAPAADDVAVELAPGGCAGGRRRQHAGRAAARDVTSRRVGGA